MERVLKFFFRFVLFWLVVFFINRAIFLISVVSFLDGASPMHAARSFLSGWLLDLSSIGYLLVLPLLLATLSIIFSSGLISRLSNIIVSIFIILYCLICFGELFLYREWMTKLTMQALLHFRHPAEVFQSAQTHTIVLFFLFSITFSAAYIIFYLRSVACNRHAPQGSVSHRKKIIAALAWMFVLAPINFLMVRGGWSAIPVSDSDAYYSQNHILNDAAVNPLWSLARNILEYTTHQEENPYIFMSDDAATANLEKMMSVEKDTTAYFLSIGKPNIVFLVLEGFTSYALPNFGGDNFAPYLDSISRKGISFTKCYAAAYASDQGIPAIFSAYPSTPKISITNQSSKTKDLPCISRDLKTLGYQSGFLFGGQLSYGNIKSYLYNARFDVLRERDDFPEFTPEGHLGIHDIDMVPLAVQELNKAHAPFMYAWFTISSHSPYDIPEPIRDLTESRENKYVNTLVYTDRAIRLFFEEAKRQAWYSSTLFVIVSDHSHLNQRNISLEDKEYHHIVSFFYGDVIRPEFRGMKIETITSQLDIAPTLLKQLHLDTRRYIFGKNNMNPHSPSFAYYDYHYGSGFITDSCFISRKLKEDGFFLNTCKDTSAGNPIRIMHEAFLQKTFEDYLAR